MKEWDCVQMIVHLFPVFKSLNVPDGFCVDMNRRYPLQ